MNQELNVKSAEHGKRATVLAIKLSLEMLDFLESAEARTERLYFDVEAKELRSDSGSSFPFERVSVPSHTPRDCFRIDDESLVCREIGTVTDRVTFRQGQARQKDMAATKRTQQLLERKAASRHSLVVELVDENNNSITGTSSSSSLSPSSSSSSSLSSSSSSFSKKNNHSGNSGSRKRRARPLQGRQGSGVMPSEKKARLLKFNKLKAVEKHNGINEARRGADELYDELKRVMDGAEQLPVDRQRQVAHQCIEFCERHKGMERTIDEFWKLIWKAADLES
jgi:hypothetical protein